jgi:hypothetical protein
LMNLNKARCRGLNSPKLVASNTRPLRPGSKNEKKRAENIRQKPDLALRFNRVESQGVPCMVGEHTGYDTTTAPPFNNLDSTFVGGIVFLCLVE